GTTETLASLNQSGGTLTGAGTLTIAGLLTLTGGTMSGAGVTNANGGMNIPNVNVFLDTRTLNASGTTAFGNATGGSGLFLQSGAVVNNLAGATWSIVNGNVNVGNGIIYNGGVAPAFNNAGTLQMTGGVSNNVSVVFNNSGTVNANVGTLNFSGVYTQTSGSTALNGGGITSSTQLNINGGTLA